MMIGFFVSTLVALIFLAIGISCLRATEAVGFFSNVKPPKIREVKKYNHGLAAIWLVSAAIMELLGVPFLFYEQNSPTFIFEVLAVLVWMIGIMIAYFRMEAKYR